MDRELDEVELDDNIEHPYEPSKDDIDDEPYSLPEASTIKDPYVREVWEEVLKAFPGGYYDEYAAKENGLEDEDEEPVEEMEILDEMPEEIEAEVKAWDESKHPRATDGRFGDTPGSHKKGKKGKKKEKTKEMKEEDAAAKKQTAKGTKGGGRKFKPGEKKKLDAKRKREAKLTPEQKESAKLTKFIKRSESMMEKHEDAATLDEHALGAEEHRQMANEALNIAHDIAERRYPYTYLTPRAMSNLRSQDPVFNEVMERHRKHVSRQFFHEAEAARVDMDKAGFTQIDKSTSEDVQMLSTAALADPGDETTRLVLADALEESGQNREAYRIREHVELGRKIGQAMDDQIKKLDPGIEPGYNQFNFEQETAINTMKPRVAAQVASMVMRDMLNSLPDTGFSMQDGSPLVSRSEIKDYLDKFDLWTQGIVSHDEMYNLSDNFNMLGSRIDAALDDIVRGAAGYDEFGNRQYRGDVAPEQNQVELLMEAIGTLTRQGRRQEPTEMSFRAGRSLDNLFAYVHPNEAQQIRALSAVQAGLDLSKDMEKILKSIVTGKVETYLKALDSKLNTKLGAKTPH